MFFLVFIKFYVGIYTHDEFYTKHFFIKHRPHLKTFFYSPRGMSDRKVFEMDLNEQKEQLLFDEFILKNQIIP